MRETTVAFKDGNDMELSDKDSRLLTRRAALAGAAGALALVGTGLMGCSDFGASANDASTTSNELTDEQKKLHNQIVATYNVEKQAAIKEQLDAECAAGGYDETAPFVKADPFGTNILSCYVRFATSHVPHHFTSNSTRSSSGTLRSMSLRAT